MVLCGQINENTTVGVGYAYGKTDADSLGRETDVEAHSIYGYAKYQPDLWYLRGLLSLGTAKYEEKSNISGFINHGDYHVHNLGANAYLGYDLPNGFTPEAGLRFNYIERENYRDSLGQQVKTDDVDIVTAVIGAKYATSIKAKNMIFTPQAYVALTYDVLSDDVNAIVNIADSIYNITAKKLSRFGAEAGIGAKINVGNWDFSAGYDLGIRDDYLSQTGMLKVKYNF